MPFPGGVVKIVFSGYMPGGEVWASGFYRVPVGDGVSMASLAAEIPNRAWYQNFQAGWRALNNSGTTLARVTCYRYPTGSSSAADVGFATLGAVGNGLGSHPNQVALVTTLRSDSGSRRGRGRMFWPATGAPMTTGGLVDNSYVTSFLDPVAAMLTDESALVVSSAGSTTRPVTSVTADNKLDTIRARAAKNPSVTTSRDVG